MTRAIVDLCGRKFGYWTVIGKDSEQKNKRESYWICECKCGAIRSVRRSKLIRSESLSCGCLFGKSKERHGMTGTDEYKTWLDIRKRCENPNSIGWSVYGGAGIKVCERWSKSFSAFYEDMGRKPSGLHSLRRIDKSAGYFKENCEWRVEKKSEKCEPEIKNKRKIKNRTQHPCYVTWIQMRQRCSNPNSDKYELYGGRGISVCERWEDFENFCDDMGERPPSMSLDRIDPNGNYEPGNCRWATIFTQNRNKRNNTWVKHMGEIKQLSDWARIYGVRAGTLSKWVKDGSFGVLADRPQNL